MGKTKKWPYLRKQGKIDKTKGTLFSRTLKVRENKVVLLFSVLPYFLRYGHFMDFFWPKLSFEQRKWPYLRKWGKIDKTKGTFFSRTLKVGENKVVLLFSVLPYFLRYGCFMISFWPKLSSEPRKWPYLRKQGKTEKTKGTTFSKLEKMKWTYFFLFCLIF